MIIDRILRAGEKTTTRRLWKLVETINSIEEIYQGMSDDDLKHQTTLFKERLNSGKDTLDTLAPEAFAVAREATRRVLGKRQYDVQLFGGLALHQGMIAEAATGSGKTIMAVAPAYLNALTGENVHVITTNDYLAATQQEQMGRVYGFLGVTSAVILNTDNNDARRAAYSADITYGTNNEFGFDYLRDNMTQSLGGKVQRGHAYAIVDEVDSILIDEARTPLLISGAPEKTDPPVWFSVFARLVDKMRAGEHYEVDEKKRTVSVQDPGFDLVEDYLGVGNMFGEKHSYLVGFLNNAVKAKELFTLNKDYIIRFNKDLGADEVLIVDEHTGRTLPGRRYNDGLHQALEAKENVPIQPENVTKATITLQNYFRMYTKLSGMTGTALTEAAELAETYQLVVVPVPDHKPNIRVDQPDEVYRDEDDKYSAVVREVKRRWERQQPVLVGTGSVAKSEHLSGLLDEAGVPHRVLNAKGSEDEALIVASAGRLGSVTVATNMAGRGTDIILGGNPEVFVEHRLRAEGIHPGSYAGDYQALYEERLGEIAPVMESEGEQVRGVGGLCVVGTERHESRRIDNQLRGRAGRQGDPGESKFFVSLGDELVRRFGGRSLDFLAARIPAGETVGSKMLTRAVESAQQSVEGVYRESRKNTVKYDDVLNRQRERFYTDRDRILEYSAGEVCGMVDGFIRDVVAGFVEDALGEWGVFWDDWDVPGLFRVVRGGLFRPSFTAAELEEHLGDTSRVTADVVVREFVEDAADQWGMFVESAGEVRAAEVGRGVVLRVMDDEWAEHLMSLDALKDGIGLRALAQRDPLVEYQREASDFFVSLMGVIKRNVVGEVLSRRVLGLGSSGGVSLETVVAGRDFLARVG